MLSKKKSIYSWSRLYESTLEETIVCQSKFDKGMIKYADSAVAAQQLSLHVMAYIYKWQ